jgi:protein-disulfide isomerase-like protein with CxxC motif
VHATPAVDVNHFTDPSCPWAYSAEPLMRALQWRFGDGLRWRTVMIGLSEDTSRAQASGSTPERRVQSWLGFQRRFGMPVLAEPRSRLISSGRACRAVVAARAQSPELSDALLRRIRLAWFTSTLLLDEDEALATVAALVPGLDVARVMSAIDEPTTEAAYQADRAETRSAQQQGQPAIAQGRTAASDGPERFTAPSILFRSGERALVAGGWQPLGAYDVCIANLEPSLPRRAAATVAEALAAFPEGLTTIELARVCTEHDDDPDPHRVTSEIAALCARGQSVREPLGFAELWRPA